ncbi:HNH endonuclease [Devosia sp. MC521]|uniref:HNH endonuclease signature motif containing protein n=1 Tax=Devosia sp. MC521 TaxID=2759954 RepID=UPI0015F85ECC|nr:HNH endonuclease [Devosia sp. MC521]MBJ6986898.1 HNH endonuclease [Devosia sp. MC521]QMW63924.1 HNH endonuclease [Devosia sp. MC521]
MARSKRYEFSKGTKREARHRSRDLCEAVGEVYGLPPGQRCNAPLSAGVEYDHYPAPATDKGSDTLENCVATCKTCHRFKTSSFDVPMQAKAKRVSDKHLGIRPHSKWASRPLGSGNNQRSATRPLIRKSEQV